jgi:tetratricopeptide (TPR) repeat protein
MLAMTHNLRGDGARAEDDARRARELLERSCAPAHPFIAHSVYMLGWACLIQRKPEADALIAESIARYERAFPDGNPEMAFPLDALGTLRARGRPREALPLLQAALDIRRRFLRPDDHWLRVSIHNLGVVHFLLKEDDAARPLLHEAIGLWRAHAPEARGNLGGSLYYAALIEERAGRLEDAAALAEEGLQHQRAAYPAGNQATANTASLLGSIRCRLGGYEEAERLLLGSWRELTAAVGRKHADAGRTAGRLVELYEKWGKPERGAEFRGAETRKAEARRQQ